MSKDDRYYLVEWGPHTFRVDRKTGHHEIVHTKPLTDRREFRSVNGVWIQEDKDERAE